MIFQKNTLQLNYKFYCFVPMHPIELCVLFDYNKLRVYFAHLIYFMCLVFVTAIQRSCVLRLN